MKKKVTITMDVDVIEAINKLRGLESRNFSNMTNVLLKRCVQSLRHEYAKTGGIQSIPKQTPTSSLLWDEECQKKFGV